MDFVTDAKRIIEKAIQEHNLTALVALFSGGADSLACLNVAREHPLFVGAIHINTKTSPLAEIASRAAVDKLEALGVEYVVKTPFLTYRQLIAKYGFPSAASHTMMYRYLKDRPIREAKKEWKRRLTARFPAIKKHNIGFITGIRAEESQRRALTPDFKWQEGTCWIAPIVRWSIAQRSEYLNSFPTTHTVHSSRGGFGECDCMAYAKEGEIETKCQVSIMDRYRLLLEQSVAVARELDLLEVEAGMRKADDVISKDRLAWGKAKSNTALEKRPTTSVMTICNDCDGQLSAEGGLGFDLDYIAGLRNAIGVLNTNA